MASKQEEIREGIKYELRKRKFTGESLSDAEYADGIVRRLHSQGVVILSPKNIGEPPIIRNREHYVVVEPLRVKE